MAKEFKTSSLSKMPWAAGEKAQRLEGLHDVLAADGRVSMSDNNDWCVSRESNLDLVAMGFAIGLDGQLCWGRDARLRPHQRMVQKRRRETSRCGQGVPRELRNRRMDKRC
jgi:hypothetical protein